MGSLGSGIFGDYGKKQTDYKRKSDFWTPEQKDTSKQLYQGVIQPGFSDSPYTGQPTDIERASLSQLQGFVGTPQYMSDASGALSRALTGQGYNQIIDPAATEKLYGAIQDRTMKDILPQAIKSASTQANVGGMLRSGTGQKLVTDEIGKVARALAEQLATLKYSDEQQRRGVAREREGRQLTAVPQVGNLSGAEFGRIQPGLRYGGMERDIAGTQFDNPLNKLALAFLGLRGQENTTGSGSTTGWNVGGNLGLKME
jgi:hypothetical protein